MTDLVPRRKVTSQRAAAQARAGKTISVFVYCERNAKGAIVTMQRSQTIAELKEAIVAQNEEMEQEFPMPAQSVGPGQSGTMLLLGGQFDKLPDGTPVQTIDLNKTCDPCGRGFSKTYQATGFPDQYYMASMFLPGELNPGAGARPMSIIFKGHVKPDEKTLAECNIVDGSTVRLDI